MIFFKFSKIKCCIFTDKEGPTVVAVKMLKENAGDQERSDLLQELQVMKMLDPHPNVVRLLGCCSEKGIKIHHQHYVSVLP